MLDSEKYTTVFFVDMMAMFVICGVGVVMADNADEHMFALLFYLAVIIIAFCKLGFERKVMGRLVLEERAWEDGTREPPQRKPFDPTRKN